MVTLAGCQKRTRPAAEGGLQDLVTVSFRIHTAQGEATALGYEGQVAAVANLAAASLRSTVTAATLTSWSPHFSHLTYADGVWTSTVRFRAVLES